MIDSSDVIGLIKIVYVIYTTIVISLVWLYSTSLTSKAKVKTKIRVPFYGWIAFLVFCGVGIHVLTFTKVPWVKWDLTRDSIKIDHEIKIQMADQKFLLPEEKLMIPAGKMVKFDLESKDLTYGFGLFREDGSLVFQMQVVPGSPNNLVWKFKEQGKFSIRSTEYSGPRGIDLFVKDAIEVYPDVSIASADSTGLT